MFMCAKFMCVLKKLSAVTNFDINWHLKSVPSCISPRFSVTLSLDLRFPQSCSKLELPTSVSVREQKRTKSLFKELKCSFSRMLESVEVESYHYQVARRVNAFNKKFSFKSNRIRTLLSAFLFKFVGIFPVPSSGILKIWISMFRALKSHLIWRLSLDH